jgi:Surface antigen
MKKLFLLSLLVFASFFAVHAQIISLTGFGGYTFQDKVTFSNAYGYLNASGNWGASIEGMNRAGYAIELLYWGQNTHIPFYFYNAPSIQVNKDNDKANLSYIMLNFLHYLHANPTVWPYGGFGIGAGILDPSDGSTESKFAWDLKMGVKIKLAPAIGFKIQAQLFSLVQAASGGFYVGTGGSGTVVSSYSSIYQFGFSGGICFDLDKSKSHQ